MPFMRVALGGTVGGKDHFVSAHRMGQACQRHIMPGIEGVEESLKLRLVRMIGDIA